MQAVRAILTAGIGLLLACHAATATAGPTEGEIKAAATVNFLLFVRWPAPRTPDASLRLCTLADAAMTPELERYDGTTVQGMRLSLRRIGRDLGEVRLCDAIYVERHNPHELPRVVAATRGQPILIVAEGENALQRGAIVALATSGARIAFDINLSAARAAGLNLSAKLLRLARSVAE